ncbi:hypothetical protein MHAE_04355 [Mycobacterium haemophilum DSM 44634]|uniref:hypothetical protein n=1 Tax=Mycobacterium haemophilum TaxID=29311 RepID=UPI00065601B7|nr:hypothetical protein [Mycobacterium haemophilum]AKN17478.1 hypothetical protein B586_14285 [Mycobacterium haemophilum DSM 44634]MCV7341601.1 hypothetical protein [Mycobacterium haemophilum DSM 44634]
MTATTHDADLKYLRKELAARFDSYPSDDWSPRLLAALIAVFDLEFGSSNGHTRDSGLFRDRTKKDAVKPNLRVVRSCDQ